MGVRGLTTYIANNHHKYLKKFKLHDCYVIIDGSSLACQLYVKFSSRAHCAFGGDYDRYAQCLRDFFSLLSKCGVKAIVLFDGGYEPRKIRTVISRMSEKISALKYVEPTSQHSPIIFPLFMKIVFKEILREMNVPFVQCDFEADQEIASLARKYDCPVLSYDSDFYIFDVRYIPIPTLELVPAPLNFQLGEASEKFCINCKMYKVEFFLDSFGGLDKSMLPLIASLLGNDYIKMKVFRKFYSQFKLPKGKGNPLQRKIARLIEWLRNETFESAVKRILGKMKRRGHRSVTCSIMKVVRTYIDLKITVEPYLPLEFTNGVVLEKPCKSSTIDCSMMNSCTANPDEMDVDNEENPYTNYDYEDLQESEESSISGNEDEEDNIIDNSAGDVEMDVDTTEHINSIQEMAMKKRIKIPDWLLERSRRGNIESGIFDITALKTYFALPQVEDNFYKSSHTTSLPLLKTISKLLVGDAFQDISLWMRNTNGKAQRFLLHLNNTKKIADIESIPALPKDKRSILLLECLEVPLDFNLDSFPEEWKLYICAIIFWMKSNSEPQITEGHLVSLLMCIVALSLIDPKVGYFRKKIGFLKKYGKLQKKIIKTREIDALNNELDNISDKEDGGDNAIDLNNLNLEEITKTTSESKTIQEIVSSVSSEECIAVFETFYQFHQVDENLKIDKKLYSSRNIHVFAQFQSCLYHSILLNSLFAFPFEQPFISRLYSGTFIYNMCTALNKLRNISGFIQTQLKYSPNILKLVEMIFNMLTSLVPVAVIQPSNKRNRRRKKKKTVCSDSPDTSNEHVEENIENDETQENYYDENNAFSLLTEV